MCDIGKTVFLYFGNMNPREHRHLWQKYYPFRVRDMEKDDERHVRSNVVIELERSSIVGYWSWQRHSFECQMISEQTTCRKISCGIHRFLLKNMMEKSKKSITWSTSPSPTWNCYSISRTIVITIMTTSLNVNRGHDDSRSRLCFRTVKDYFPLPRRL